jgi:hypothetical protein
MTLTLSMEEDDGFYQVADIGGLDPVKANLSSSSYAGRDGERFQTARRSARNITIKLDLDPDFNPKSFTELRQDLYTYFMPKSEIRIRFYQTTGLYVDILAVVEEMSSPLFEQDPVVNISLMCFNPDFVDPNVVQLEDFTVNDLTTTEIDYPGSVETGVVLTLNLNRDIDEFTIYNTGEDGIPTQLVFQGELLEDDVLVVSSVRGSKGIKLTRLGVTSSFLYGRQAQSTWIELMEGLNQFRVYAEGDPIPYVLEYSVKYGAL